MQLNEGDAGINVRVAAGKRALREICNYRQWGGDTARARLAAPVLSKTDSIVGTNSPL